MRDSYNYDNITETGKKKKSAKLRVLLYTVKRNCNLTDCLTYWMKKTGANR